MQRLFFAALLAAALPLSASAQRVVVRAQAAQPQPVQVHAQPAQVQVHAQPAQVQVQPTYVAQQAQPQQPQRDPRQLTGYMHVPFFLSDDPLPGLGVSARMGWEFGMFMPEASIGFANHFLPSDFVVPTTGGTRSFDHLQNIWFTLGARFQFLNPTRFIPFVSGAFRGNFWSYRSNDDVTTDFEFDPGAQVSAGLAIELTPRLGMELAVQGNVNFPVSDVFDKTRFVLHPVAGLTAYY